ncbi:MAG: hypothetical protein OHK0039_26650 [Bacteroidia bacterium]
MEATQHIFNLIILDESGSMQSIKAETIQGFNEIVQTIKGSGREHPDQVHSVSLVTFNGLGTKMLLFNEPADRVEELNNDRYRPDASTPLYDAMGHGINQLRAVVDACEGPCSVLVTILTDGEENASREYSGQAIQALVEELKQKNWTFTYIGANHNVHHVAMTLSIDHTLAYQSTPESTQEMFEAEREARARYYSRSPEERKFSKFFHAPDDSRKNDKS